MSGTEWRFTDEQGVERTIDTPALRAALASGKIAPSTLVWHEGLKEWAPAFTLPELSSAAIAAGRTARASIPPTGGSATATPVATNATGERPRSIPPPVPKRVPSVAPPVPVRKPHRGPMRTLTGLEPPELLESLGLNAKGNDIHDEATRDVTSDGDEDWDDATDVIPLAPKVPKEAANLPRSVRRIPSIPPPPLPANPTPPPANAAPAPVAERRPTLMGLAQRKPSKPPPRRASFTNEAGSTSAKAASDPDRTAIAPTTKTDTGIGPPPGESPRSKPPPPPPRKRFDTGKLPTTTPASGVSGPKRLNKTLELDTKLANSLDRSKPAPPARSKNDAPTVVSKQEIIPPAAEAKPAAETKVSGEAKTVLEVKVPADAKAAASAATPAAPPVKTKPETKPTSARDSNTGTITTVAKPNGPRKTEEGTVIMERPVKAPSKSESTEIMASRPTDAVKRAVEEKASETPKQQLTLEMELEDHTVAAEKHPESPVSMKPKGEDTGTTFQVDQEDGPEEAAHLSSAPPEPVRARKKSALEVPVSSLIAASMVWIVGLLAFFFVGRISGFKSAGQAPVASDGLGDKFLAWAPPAELGGAGFGDPKPCSVTRQPKKWASSASKSVPFDMRAEGEMSLLGFAQGDREGVGLRIDPKTGKFEETFRLKVESDIVRVSPTGTTEGFFVGTKGDRTIVPASASSPRFLVFEKGSIGAADATDAAASQLWTLDGEGEIGAETVQRVNEETFFLSFRRGNDVYGGYFGADKAAKGALARVQGSG